MKNWYYCANNKAHGPVDRNVLLQIISAGELHENDLVIQEGENSWRPIAACSELSMALSRASHLHEFVELPRQVPKDEWVLLLQLKTKTEVRFIQKGPLTAEEVKRQLMSGAIRFSDHAWKQGYRQWIPLSKIIEFQKSASESEKPVIHRLLTDSQEREAIEEIEGSEEQNEGSVGFLPRFEADQRGLDFVPQEAVTEDLVDSQNSPIDGALQRSSEEPVRHSTPSTLSDLSQKTKAAASSNNQELPGLSSTIGYWLTLEPLLVRLRGTVSLLACLAAMAACWVVGFEVADKIWEIWRKPAQLALGTKNYLRIKAEQKDRRDNRVYSSPTQQVSGFAVLKQPLEDSSRLIATDSLSLSYSKEKGLMTQGAGQASGPLLLEIVGKTARVLGQAGYWTQALIFSHNKMISNWPLEQFGLPAGEYIVQLKSKNQRQTLAIEVESSRGSLKSLLRMQSEDRSVQQALEGERKRLQDLTNWLKGRWSDLVKEQKQARVTPHLWSQSVLRWRRSVKSSLPVSMKWEGLTSSKDLFFPMKWWQLNRYYSQMLSEARRLDQQVNQGQTPQVSGFRLLREFMSLEKGLNRAFF